MNCSRRMMNVSALLCSLAYFILTVDLTLAFRAYPDMEFTFLLPAGRTECFYQTTMMNNSIEIEYQVIAGSGLDVGFVLVSPGGHLLVSDFRSSDGIHKVSPTDDGDYRLCFDNSFSTRSEKIVFFGLFIRTDSQSSGQDTWTDMATVTEGMVEYKLEDIRVSVDSVYQHLERSRQVLTVLRAFEARDRYLLEDNLWRVSFWSCINLLVMLAVAATQMYTLRSLFDNVNRVRT
ncbi:transmembrane emp24 domain-containing protein 1-like [Solea senegalensis]|uniref:Transmembrane emp24 domain-containing protein 1-like n=1 Tax=Solea senegalensis TaxID=28829 RepID=A0AAV6RKH8_SOLSE|nr:transmembrane emp24 domain-containing protein 1-like [Solea senegalensis]KAG7505660.1 transmembrane emp24 domain-containing protein 1-like [Solea senegalensis]